jgi:hypothetical protein
LGVLLNSLSKVDDEARMDVTIAIGNLHASTPQPAFLPAKQRCCAPIVVVEDPMVSGLLRSVLQRKGYPVIQLGASDGVRLLRSADARVALLITNQPEAFTEFAGFVPLLYLAAFPDPAVASPFHISRMLRKPFRPEQLLNCVEQLLLPM